MAAENSLLEFEAFEVPAVNKTAYRNSKPNFFGAGNCGNNSKVQRKSSSTEIKVY